VIEISALTKRYGDYTAVDNLNLSIGKGEIFGLLGPNGAGKSTTILMILGLTEPTSGSVTVCGIDATRNPIEVKRKVGYLPEDVGFYEDYTGLENLLYTAQLNGMSWEAAEQRARHLLDRVGLVDEADKKAGKYSRGMRQRLGLADVLIKSPEVIILDEPTLGIDPQGVREFLELIARLSHDEGLTVLLSSHHLHHVQEVCDRVGLFVKGKLLAVGTIGQLSQDLFANEPFLIEAGIDSASDALKAKLSSIPGVMSVTPDTGVWRIGCTRNAAPDIAKTVVENGATLNYLKQNQYGLDDIYYHYFQKNGTALNAAS
jgi:ABC-2 type transport system ATP-binding protein